MAARRAFYVTQGCLTVWQNGKAGPLRVNTFADNDTGLHQFDRYLADNGDQTSFVLIDVIEEEFASDTIPKLGARDRAALVRRRMQRKFPRTPYRLPVYHGKASGNSDAALVIHSAISNHELLDPWLQTILRHEIPLTGIFSVPLMAAELIGHLHTTSARAMIVTQHQQYKLRQVFLQNGHVQSARLSQSPALDDEEYPQFLLTEIGRSRRYLERSRLLTSVEQLDVYVVAASSLAERILNRAQTSSPLRMHFIKPDVAAQRLGISSELQQDKLETLYLALSFRRQPKHSYAVSGESRFWQMRRLRHALIGASVAVAAVCSVLSGLYLSDAWLLQKRSTDIENQLTQLTATFRRENEQFDPIKADSHEMKLAVDTGDFILSNRLPVPWVMQQLGFVMGNYPDIKIMSLGWSAESAAPENPMRRQRGEQPMPVPVPTIIAINANITADIAPFDGNMRKAFARIDALAAELQERTAFSDVAAVEYPLDARPQASISGEIVGKGITETARFRLRLRMPLQPAVATTAEMNNDSV